MSKRKKVVSKDLVKSVEAGEIQADIMKKFGYKTSTQLKTAYMNALIEAGKVTPITGGRSAGKAAKVKLLGVGKRGSIVISKELVEKLGVDMGEKFAVRKTKAGIALKKVSE
jgi:hypothetical protein